MVSITNGTAAAQRGQSILVADDDDEFRAALAEIITLAGWSVTQARNGAEALAQTLATKPSALVLDQRMPLLTGVEVVRRLRRARHPVPVVLISAAHDLDTLVATNGLTFGLRKPFGMDAIVDLLERAIGRKG